MAELTPAMVTITADEYFKMRSEAETSLYLATKFSEIERRLDGVYTSLYELEKKVNKNA